MKEEKGVVLWNTVQTVHSKRTSSWIHFSFRLVRSHCTFLNNFTGLCHCRVACVSSWCG